MNKNLTLILGSFMLLGLVGVVIAQDNMVTSSPGTVVQPYQFTQSNVIYSSDIQPGTMVPGGTIIKESVAERLQQEYKTAVKLIQWSKEYRMWDITTNKWVYFPDMSLPITGRGYSTSDIQQVDGHYVIVGLDYSKIPSDVKLYNLE